MVRLLARLILNILANAVGLLAAALLLDNFSVNTISFIVAVFVFSLATTVLGPLIMKIALTSASYLMGGIALVTTFVGLLVTSVVTDGIVIRGVSTWFISTMIVWGFSIIGSLLFPRVIFKKTLENQHSK